MDPKNFQAEGNVRTIIHNIDTKDIEDGAIVNEYYFNNGEGRFVPFKHDRDIVKQIQI